MNILRFLREHAKGYDCTVCGSNHAGSEIRVLGKVESAWIVRVTCSNCQTALKLLVVVDERRTSVSRVREERSSERRRPPVTADEVIDAHDYLREFEGDVDALFRRRERLVDARGDERA